MIRIYPMPVPVYRETQAELLWRFTWSPLASNMASIVAMLEGGGGHRQAVDLETDPSGALDVSRHARQGATRASRVDARLANCGAHARETLRLVYGELPHPLVGIVFGRLGTLAPETHTASEEHRRARSRAPMPVWLSRLTSKVQRGTASEREYRAKRRIQTEAETRVIDALAEYRDRDA